MVSWVDDWQIFSVFNNKYCSVNNQQSTVPVFFDFSEALDCVNLDNLIKELHHYGIWGIDLELLKSYPNNRDQLVKTNSSISPTKLIWKCGVLQGSVLGPIRFLLFIHDFAGLEIRSKISAFADDKSFNVWFDASLFQLYEV